MRLFYGQIRPTNYAALAEHYGCEPPWPMEGAPHVSLVQAVLSSADPRATSYYDYLQRTHGHGAEDELRKHTRQIENYAQLGRPVTASVEHESVLDGNHRVAFSIVSGVPIEIERAAPYQTLEFPDRVVEGRRMGARDLDYVFEGKHVIDLGCCDGMMSITALRRGARNVTAVDRSLRSTTWQLRDAWGFGRMKIEIADIHAWNPPADADVVIVCSVMAYLDPEKLRTIVKGRDCILETHISGCSPPSTGHHWTRIGTSPYRRAEPDLEREIFLGRP